MQLAENLTRLGNINAALGAIRQGLSGLRLLVAEADLGADRIDELRDDLRALTLLHELTDSGPGAADLANEIDWSELADRHGIHLGLSGAWESEQTRQEWAALLEAPARLATSLLDGLDYDAKLPQVDDDLRERVEAARDDVERLLAQVAQRTSVEQSELFSGVRGLTRTYLNAC